VETIFLLGEATAGDGELEYKQWAEEKGQQVWKKKVNKSVLVSF
jgi:hypothetical protein